MIDKQYKNSANIVLFRQIGQQFNKKSRYFKRDFIDRHLISELFQFQHNINTNNQQNNKCNTSAPYLEILPAGQWGFYLFDNFHRIRNANCVIDKDRIFDNLVYVQIPVSFHN